MCAKPKTKINTFICDKFLFSKVYCWVEAKTKKNGLPEWVSEWGSEWPVSDWVTD